MRRLPAKQLLPFAGTTERKKTIEQQRNKDTKTGKQQQLNNPPSSSIFSG